MGMVEHCLNIVDKATFGNGTSRLGARRSTLSPQVGQRALRIYRLGSLQR